MSLAPQPMDRPNARWRWRHPGLLVSLVAALVVGVFLGRSIGYYRSVGGESVLGAAFIFGVTVIGVVAAAIIWPVLARLLGRSAGRALASVGLAAVALVAGAVVGAATAGFTGGTYQPPVTLQARATIQSELSGTGLAMASVDGAAGQCESEPDSHSIGSVTALDLGSFGSGRLRGFITFSPDGNADGWAMIDGSDADPEVLPIQWAGALRVMSVSPDRSTGHVFFADVPLVTDAKLPGASIGPEWPRTIRGDVSWQCEPLD